MARGYRFGVVGSLSLVPDGRTVLPVNDVDLLLQCAGIKGSLITTLAELFADTTTLQTVINSNNAIDYLVRSTDFTKQKSVPTMTSNTTPSGECFSSGARDTSYVEWKAFDNNNSTEYQASTAAIDTYIGYKFTSGCKIIKALIYCKCLAQAGGTENFKLEASNDGTNWTTLVDTISFSFSGAETKNQEITFTNGANYTYYRLYKTSNVNIRLAIPTLQFYTEDGFCDNSTAMQLIGANNYASDTLLGNGTWREAICGSSYFESVLNAKVPVMTSNTTPSGECSASGYTQQNMPYKAFDGLSSSGWISDTKGNSWIQYQFTSVVKFCMVTKKDVYNRFNTFKIQTSSDGTTFTDVTDTLTNSLDVTAIASTVISGQYVRLQVLSNTTNYNDGIYGTTQGLQFYCRADV